MFRWWPPSVDAATAVAQLRQVAAAGHKGVEIAMVMHTYLDLGAVSGAYRVFVNGRQAPVPDQLGATVDLGGLIRPGPNVIEVKVASTLLNRLRTHRPAEFGSRARTVNGLSGPVTLRSYVPGG